MCSTRRIQRQRPAIVRRIASTPISGPTNRILHDLHAGTQPDRPIHELACFPHHHALVCNPPFIAPPPVGFNIASVIGSRGLSDLDRSAFGIPEHIVTATTSERLWKGQTEPEAREIHRCCSKIERRRFAVPVSPARPTGARPTIAHSLASQPFRDVG